MENNLWSIGRILKWTEQYFRGKGVASPRLDAEVLLSHVLGKARIYLYVHFDQPLDKEELAAYRDLVKRRASHVPVAYLTGRKGFMGLSFRVTPDVLIPRPETEILVQAALDGLKSLPPHTPESPLEFADIGTGSGAICLAVLHGLPEARAAATDLSPNALAVAEENAHALGLADHVSFHEGDLLAPFMGRQFDAILANPPYIPTKDILGLAPDVRDYEPTMALDGGEDGMDFYRRLIREGIPLLKEGGFLAFEMGIRQAQPIRELAATETALERPEIHKDYAGIERVIIFWKKKAG